MRLTYADLPGDGGRAALVLHAEATSPTGRAPEIVRAAGVTGRVVAPYGDYATYPSGMDMGGRCWYRVLPGYAGTDPVSLTTAVVQVGDLLEELALGRPLLVGWGQGAVVALGAALLRAASVGPVVCVDAPTAHLAFLPVAVWAPPLPPDVLLAASGPGRARELAEQQDHLAARGLDAETWCGPGRTAEEGGRALAEQIERRVEGR